MGATHAENTFVNFAFIIEIQIINIIIEIKYIRIVSKMHEK
jgi:hypothetical protein